VLLLSVSLAPKLRVTIAETEHMPIYLRTFFRVLSSWVHAIYQRKRPPRTDRGGVVGATLGPARQAFSGWGSEGQHAASFVNASAEGRRHPCQLRKGEARWESRRMRRSGGDSWTS
jgi:hypothetical protein